MMGADPMQGEGHVAEGEGGRGKRMQGGGVGRFSLAILGTFPYLHLTLFLCITHLVSVLDRRSSSCL